MASNAGFSVTENKLEVSSISNGADNKDPKKLGIEKGVDVVVEVVVVAAVVVVIAVVGLVLKNNSMSSYPCESDKKIIFT